MRTTLIRRAGVGGENPVRLMGVINTSPESFFHGSYVPSGNILSNAGRMIDEGALIIDLGARSTAPQSRPITVEEECRRLKSSLAELEGTGIPISVDTMYADALDLALRYDIAAINDIHGLADDRFAERAAESGLPVIAMATIHEPGDPHGADETMTALALVTERAEAYGIRDLILDPGIGRWVPSRTPEDDWDLCRRFSDFLTFERPLLGAISRKSFIGDLLGKPAEERLAGTLGLTALLVMAGAAMIRTHDIAATRDVIRVCEKIQEER